MKYFLFLFAFLFFVSFEGFSQKKKILIVTSNTETVNNRPNGTFLMEIAYPFHFFSEQGYEVDVVSPAGGKIPIYSKFELSEDLKEIIKSEAYINKTSNSLLPEQVDTDEYCAVFYPGGYGQFWDIVKNQQIAEITAEIYESGGVVGSAGHGTASLVNVRLSSGKYLVEDKTLTSFPTWFETAYMTDANYGKLLPFDMEKELLLRGANLQKSTREDKGQLGVVDRENRIVTGAFADDALFVAKEMDKLIEQMLE